MTPLIDPLTDALIDPLTDAGSSVAAPWMTRLVAASHLLWLAPAQRVFPAGASKASDRPIVALRPVVSVGKDC